MVPPLLINLTDVDLNRVQIGVEEIERVNPHRGVMRMLDGIHWMSPDITAAVAYKDVKGDEFWVPGHIPGRPIFPGVLQLEAAAQLASYLTLLRMTHIKFMGFAGLEGVKFRGQVLPGDRLLILGKEVECRPRRCICSTQGLVRGTVVFEATVVGMPM